MSIHQLEMAGRGAAVAGTSLTGNGKSFHTGRGHLPQGYDFIFH